MSTLPKEAEESVQLGGASPTMEVVNASHNFEQPIEASVSSGSPPHITIDNESMQVDKNNGTVDRTKDPFKDFGPTIVGNVVHYSSSIDEEKEEEKQKEEEIHAQKLVGAVRDIA